MLPRLLAARLALITCPFFPEGVSVFRSEFFVEALCLSDALHSSATASTDC